MYIFNTINYAKNEFEFLGINFSFRRLCWLKCNMNTLLWRKTHFKKMHYYYYYHCSQFIAMYYSEKM